MKCPKTKSATHCLTKWFPIYRNKHWTIRRRDDHSADPSSNRIILKIVGFQEKQDWKWQKVYLKLFRVIEPFLWIFIMKLISFLKEINFIHIKNMVKPETPKWSNSFIVCTPMHEKNLLPFGKIFCPLQAFARAFSSQRTPCA